MNNFNIQKEQFISFDVFDTLIKRLVFHPHQVFQLMEINDNTLPNNFKEIRIQAERAAGAEKSFYTIEDIYDHISFQTEEGKKRALELEIKTELDVCVPNPEMVEMYQECITQGKCVIITSDMYLSRQYIKKLLDSCGITGYEKLYISCEKKANKRQGKLFQYILKDLQINPKQLVHIGDNKKSDYLRPKSMGIHSVLYKQKQNKIYTATNKYESDYKNQQSFLNQMFNLKYKNIKESVPFRIGYLCMGPLLYGFTKWLEQEFQKDGIEKVFFLSRDGKIMMDAYEIIEGQIPHQYFYASRKALIIPTIWKHPKLEEATRLFFKTKDDTVASVLGKLGGSVDRYKLELNSYTLNPNSKIDFTNLHESSFLTFYNQIQRDIIKNSKRQHMLLAKYLKDSAFIGKVAVVDIGWFGNMQRAITEIVRDNDIEADVHGYYLGIDPLSKSVEEYKLNVKGFLFEKGNTILRKYEKAINAIVEYMFSTTHGSVLGYQEQGNKVKPVFAQYEYDKNEEFYGEKQLLDEKEILMEIQQAALCYIKDLGEHKLFATQKFSPETCFSNLQMFGNKPIKKDLLFWGDLRILGSDDKYRYFARPSKIKNPKKLKLEFDAAGWRIGYLKRKTHTSIPYSKLYFMIRKVLGKSD